MNEPSAAAPRVRRVTELIQLGRDREAAELAAAADGTAANGGFPEGGRSMDVLTQLDEVGPLLGTTVAGITPEQLDNPTPCASFTVRGVLEHMIGGATAFAAAFRGEEAPAVDTTDVLAGFGPALGNLAAAIQEPGALDRTITAPFGQVDGESFARFVVLDGLVHGWDLATATGQDYEPSEVLVTDVEAFAIGVLAGLRDGKTFGDPVAPSPSATPIERLAAFTGRRA